MVLGLINYDVNEAAYLAAYLDEVERLTSWCQNNCLSLNVSKTKELIVDLRKRQQRSYTPLMISGTPVERVSSFKYLGVNISEDLTWTTHIQTQVKKARQRLYHLRQLSKFRVSPTILKTFYSGAIESVLTQCISVWYGNSSNQDCKALQRVVHLAERISGSALPSLQVTYLKRCKSRAAKIIKDSTHPGNHLFRLLPSGKRFRSMMAKTERLRRSFFPQAHQAPEHKPSLIITYKIVTGTHPYSHHPYFCVHTLNNQSAHPSYSNHYLLSPSTLFFAHPIAFCTSYCFLHILLFYTSYWFALLYCTFYSYSLFFLPYICSCVVLPLYNSYFLFFCTVH